MRTPLAAAGLLVAAVLFAAPSAEGKDKEKERIQVAGAERQGDLEILTCVPRGKALLYFPTDLEPGKKPGLLVTLHGHGGKPEGYVFRDFASRRKWAVMAIQGRSEVQGAGFQWDGSDATYIAQVAKWCVQNRGIDPT